ncbi:MAG: Holliday junction resolvase RuvX [Gammaproteobacteria bacterium]|nr:Holliday junction resolvase RuvX [Gammaproteobacteria bacterium]
MDDNPAPPGRSVRLVLGFDYGLKNIGVAVGQELTRTATPLATVRAVAGRPDWEAITTLIREWRPDALVVGVPRHRDGSAHAMTEAAQRFARRIEGRYRLPVYTVDERLSSREAQHLVKIAGMHRRRARGTVDDVAAQVILHTWFEQQRDDHEHDDRR